MSRSPNKNRPDDAREYFEERAGILEFCEGMSRPEAEREALRRTLVRYGEAAVALLKFEWGPP